MPHQIRPRSVRMPQKLNLRNVECGTVIGDAHQSFEVMNKDDDIMVIVVY